MTADVTHGLARLLPEVILGLAAIAVFLLDLRVRSKARLGAVALAALALAALALVRVGTDAGASLFGGMVVDDPFARFFHALFALAGGVVVWMSLASREVRRVSEGEYYALLLCATAGLFLMARANHLLMAYLSLEFVSLTSYVLSGMLRHDRRSGEAALKYLVYGGVASGTMIYGMSWIFGLTGSMEFGRIQAVVAAGQVPPLPLFLGILLLMAGLGFKISAVPFHMWAPDVYTGAPIPVAAFLAVGSKAAGFALLMRIFFAALSSPAAGGLWQAAAGVGWPQVVLVVAVATMTLGNLGALTQSNLKRMLAYSGVAHAGYLLMGFAVLSDEGLRAMMFYLAVYLLMNLGAFLAVMIVADRSGGEDIDAFRGLAWRGGALPAVAMAVFLFSLTGLPPLAGFVGKFYLFAAVVRQQQYLLAVAGVLNSVLSLYYYARVVRTMFLDFPEGGESTLEIRAREGVLLCGLALLTVLLGVYWAPLIAFADRSLRFATG